MSYNACVCDTRITDYAQLTISLSNKSLMMKNAMEALDPTIIQSQLEAGMIGRLSFPDWLIQVGRAPEDTTDIAKTMAENGVVELRWEPGEGSLAEQRLWQAYLVISLSTPTIPPLKMIHDIVVEKCGASFYFLKGRELWVEYLVAKPEARATIASILEAGMIGEMPYPTWLQYIEALTNIWIISGKLAALGVVSVRWERSEFALRCGRWQAYLVITLPMSSSSSAPALPSYRLLSRIAIALRNNHDFDQRATEYGMELWVSFEMDLPLDDKALKLLGIKTRLVQERDRAE
jgi:hypothetical protein